MALNCIKIAFLWLFLFSCNEERKGKSDNCALSETKESQAEKGFDFSTNQVEIENKIKNSANEIDGVIRVLDSLIKQNDYQYLKYYGHALDDNNNQIVIMLGDTSDFNIEQFKIKVLNSPYLRFEKTEKFQFE